MPGCSCWREDTPASNHYKETFYQMRSDAGSVDAVRAGVVGRLRARRDELVEAIFRRVQAGAFAGAGDGDAEYVAGLRAAVVAAVEYVLEGIERGEGWVGPIPVVASEQARRAARMGVSLDTVLRRYLVGHTLFEQFVMDEAERGGVPGGREAVRGALRAQAAVLDRLLERIAGEYGDELARIGRPPLERRAEQVRRLLEGGVVEGPGLDYEIEDRWHLGVIAAGAAAAQAVRGLAVSSDRRLLSIAQDGGLVWAWLGGRERFAVGELERAVADGIGSQRIGSGGRESHSSLVLALGEPAPGLQGWRATHQQAQAALVVAQRRNRIPRNRSPRDGNPRNGIPSTPGAVTRYADVALLATALNDELLASALLDVYIAPLEDSRGSGPVLRETLRAYFAAERNASSAAAALGVVRNTVDNRLRAIEEQLGRTLHPCPAELEVALQLEELGVAPGPPESSTAGEIIS
jgi:hypothetical protein